MRGASRALVVRFALLFVLGSSGCMLDTDPLRSNGRPASGTNTSTSTDSEHESADPPGAPDSSGGIITGMCLDDAGSCGGVCSQDSDCPVPSACHTAVCVEGSCQEEASACDPEDAGSDVTDATCAAGARECVDQKLRSCGKDGHWTTPTACEHGCNDNACNSECRPGSTQCSASNEAQSCGATGRWGARTACESGCVDGHCTPCTEGAKRCSADMQETCSAAGSWQASPCSVGCVGDHCAACKAGTRECTGSDMNDLRVCSDNGEWGTATTCPSSCMDGQCADCTPGTQRCAGPGVQLCGLDRRWQTLESCPNGCDGMQCATCREGAYECPSRTTIRVCRDHMWSDADNCRPNAHCDSSAPAGNTCPCDSGFSDPHPNPGLCMTSP